MGAGKRQRPAPQQQPATLPAKPANGNGHTPAPTPAKGEKQPIDPNTPITKEQGIELGRLLKEKGIPWDWLLSRMNVQRAGELTVSGVDAILGNMTKLAAEHEADMQEADGATIQ